MKRIGFYITLAVAFLVLVFSIIRYRNAFTNATSEPDSTGSHSITIFFDCPSVTAPEAYLGAMLVGPTGGPEDIPLANYQGSISNGVGEIHWDNLPGGPHRFFFMIRQVEDYSEGLISGDMTNNRYILIDIGNTESLTIMDSDLMTH